MPFLPARLPGVWPEADHYTRKSERNWNARRRVPGRRLQAPNLEQEWLATVREAIHLALGPVADAHDLLLVTKVLRYNKHNFVLRLEGAVISTVSQVALTPEAEMFRRTSSRHGLAVSHLGQVVHLQGRDLRITGWNRRAFIYPIMLEDSNGKAFKADVASVREALGLTNEHSGTTG